MITNIFKIQSIRCFLFFLFIFVLTSNSNAQRTYKLENIDNKIFTDGYITGELHKMGHVFEEDALMYEMFKRFDKYRKWQNGVRAAYFSTIGLGMIGGMLISNAGSNGLNEGSGALLGILSGAILGLPILYASVALKDAKNKNKNKLLSYYNDEFLSKQNLDQSKLHMGMTNNGLGLVYQF